MGIKEGIRLGQGVSKKGEGYQIRSRGIKESQGGSTRVKDYWRKSSIGIYAMNKVPKSNSWQGNQKT